MEKRGQPAEQPQGTPVDQLAGDTGLSHIDPNDPAAPNYELVARLRGALSLREMMIHPVRTGYLGDDKIDPKLLPPLPPGTVPERGRGAVLRAVAGRPDTLRGVPPGERTP